MGDHIEYLGRSAYINSISTPQSKEQPKLVIKFDLSFESVGDFVDATIEVFPLCSGSAIVLVDLFEFFQRKAAVSAPNRFLYFG